jgi:2'-hydroxyisoflavone reductase
VRSGVIAGPGDPTDRFAYWPLRMARGGEMIGPGSREDRMAFIDVRDLDDWVVRAIEEKTMGVYNAVGPTNPSLGAVLDEVNGAVGNAARITWIDQAWLEEHHAGGWGDFPLAVPSGNDDSGFAKVSAARAVAKGLRFRPPAETARDALSWWNAQPEARRAQPRPGITPEREAELLRQWHASHARAG